MGNIDNAIFEDHNELSYRSELPGRATSTAPPRHTLTQLGKAKNVECYTNPPTVKSCTAEIYG